MGYFAKVENSIVTHVIVADADYINSGAVGDPSIWIETDLNTRSGIHYGPDGNPDGEPALRFHYAGIGYIYNKIDDVFYPPSPYPSWKISAETGWTWTAPTPIPDPIEGYYWSWDEDAVAWVSKPRITNPT
jgi:hypothetical protein